MAADMNNLLTDLADGNKAIKDLRLLAKCDEDLFWGVLFPINTKEFLTARESART